jgi:hypothetical protein
MGTGIVVLLLLPLLLPPTYESHPLPFLDLPAAVLEHLLVLEGDGDLAKGIRGSTPASAQVAAAIDGSSSGPQ